MYRLAGRLSHRYHLQGHDIDHAALCRGEVVGQAQAFAFSLPGEVEALHFAPALTCVAWVVDNQLVAPRLAGEIDIDDPGLQVTRLSRRAQNAIQARAKLSLYQAGK